MILNKKDTFSLDVRRRATRGVGKMDGANTYFRKSVGPDCIQDSLALIYLMYRQHPR